MVWIFDIVWVVPYLGGELYAAVKYISQAEGGKDGVDVLAARDENINGYRPLEFIRLDAYPTSWSYF